MRVVTILVIILILIFIVWLLAGGGQYEPSVKFTQLVSDPNLELQSPPVRSGGQPIPTRPVHVPDVPPQPNSHIQPIPSFDTSSQIISEPVSIPSTTLSIPPTVPAASKPREYFSDYERFKDIPGINAHYLATLKEEHDQKLGIVNKNRHKHKSKAERQVCDLANRIFGAQFDINVHPDWLYNSETKTNLELDCYWQDGGLAIEYNGYQHYHCPNQYMTECTPENELKFQQQLRRDELKKELCELMGVYLIVIPYTVKPKDYERLLTEHYHEYQEWLRSRQSTTDQ